MEDALYDIASMQLFASLSLNKAVPNQTTILKFRHLLEHHDVARKIFEGANQ
jgi:IS5 family transposase